MSTSKQFMGFLLEQLSDVDGVTYRPMMGEYLIYVRGNVAADVCDDRLLVKPVPAARKLLPNAPLEPPYKGAKDMLLVEDTDDRELMTELFNAIYDELPAPKPKKKKA